MFWPLSNELFCKEELAEWELLMLRLLMISARLIYFSSADNFHLDGDVSEEQTEFQVNAETMLGTITFLELFPAFPIRRMVHPISLLSCSAKIKSRTDG